VLAVPAGTGAGHAPIDNSNRVAYLITRRIDEGLIDEGAGLEEIAAEFEISSRQFAAHCAEGTWRNRQSNWMQTRRLLSGETVAHRNQLPVTEIAFASGFSSLRRFNDAFGTQYRMPPTRLRKRATSIRND